jgi:transposase
LDEQIKELDREIAHIAASDPVAKRLQQLRGVGSMIATAIVANVGNAIEAQGGTITASSQSGQGTSFYFTLPDIAEGLKH